MSSQQRETSVEAFADSLSYPLDPFQREGAHSIAAGKSVLVAAPTGAGKTVVGEYAIFRAFGRGRKAFYTTPIKALSNQKYHDLVARYGSDQVGLLTGDISVNGEAPIVVMTTEVLRNMLYAGSSTLTDLDVVVMDEVHYLADRSRGAVWEEVIITLPPSVALVALSATVSNVEEFGEWLRTVRGEVDLVLSETRPIPLWQHMQVGNDVFDLFAETEESAPTRNSAVNPRLVAAVKRASATDFAAPRGQRNRQSNRGGRRSGGQGQRSGRPRFQLPSRAQVISELDRDGLLPAITFIFSRAGCESAVNQLLNSDLRLLPQSRSERVRIYIEEAVAGMAIKDLEILGYDTFVHAAMRGFAAHHAGMLPTFREIVEQLFVRGDLKAVFATETLALGINMPARTVVLEKLVKYNGQSHEPLTPSEYTQLTGRAGRRGIDTEGHAVVLWQPGLGPTQVAGLASTRTYPLRSSFSPTYNMAANMLAHVGRARAREVLQSSFAQFQADSSVVDLAGQIRRNQEVMAEYAEAMQCDRGDFAEYAQLRNSLTDLEKGRPRGGEERDLTSALDALRVGDVIMVRAGRSWVRGAVIVAADPEARGVARLPLVITQRRQSKRVSADDVASSVASMGTVRLPRKGDDRSAKYRSDVAALLTERELRPHRGTKGSDPDGESPGQVREAVRAHPCHQCPEREQHASWARRWWQLDRANARLQKRVDTAGGSVASTFDRVCDALAAWGYVKDDELTAAGERLRGIYGECDLLVAQCLATGTWEGLDVAELAAVVSAAVHQPRGESEREPVMPSLACEKAWRAMENLADDIELLERQHGLNASRRPEPGLMEAIHRWSTGATLAQVMRATELAPGDFVRRCKQVIDALDQVAHAATDEGIRTRARQARGSLLRSVVAADRID